MDSFEEKLVRSWPLRRWEGMTLLLAVSGGADSVALLRAATALAKLNRAKLIVGHLNHQLRGDSSDADEYFVRQLASDCDCEIIVERANVTLIAAQRGDGIEEAARRCRYTFLQEQAEKLGARYVVTAHTANDQAETVLHRIVRGTGIEGLAGMRRARPLGQAVALLRPLLDFKREEVIDYLQRLGQPFCHDASNDDARFTRNRIRQRLIPELVEQYNPNIIDSLLRLSQVAAGAQQVVDDRVEQIWSGAVTRLEAGELHIDLSQLQKERPAVISSLLIRVWREQDWPRQAMGHREWIRLSQMCELSPEPSPAPSQQPPPQQSPSQQILPGEVTAQKRGEQLILTRPDR